MTERWLPNLFIAGVPKAGTSSLFSWLADHPDALGARDKETYFFVDPSTHMHRPAAHVSTGYDPYARQFQRPGPLPRVRLEATPGYIYYQTALDHIPDLPSTPKCLFIVREPASQIYSLFRYFQGNWDWIPADLNFADYIALLYRGQGQFKGNELAEKALIHAHYVTYLTRWRARLGPDRMMVLTFDALLADQAALTRQVADWVGLDTAFYEAYSFPRQNETYAPRARWLQRINRHARGVVPKGRSYDALRRAYRRVNTRKLDTPSDLDAEVLAELRADFATSNAQLAQEFGLDLAGWG